LVSLAGWILGASLALLSAAGAAGGQAAQTAQAEFLLQGWDTEQGLPSATVTAIAHTPDGFLWVGTANGLARFDGNRFQNEPRAAMRMLRDKEITCLTADERGGLWVATKPAGLYHLENGRLESIDLGTNTPPFQIRSMALAVDGTLLVATSGREASGSASLLQYVADDALSAPASGKGLLRHNQQGWQASSNGLPYLNATRVICDRDGGIWCLMDGHLVHQQRDTWKIVSHFETPDLQIRDIAPARGGGIWVATSSGPPATNNTRRVFHISPDSMLTELSPYLWSQDNLRTRITTLCEDKAGTLWVGTFGGGVYYRPAGGSWSLLRSEGPTAEIVVNVIESGDKEGVWLGFYSGGLLQVRPRTVRALKLPPPARQNIVLTACAAMDGSVWVGTDGAGVFRYQDGVFKVYGQEQGLDNLAAGVLLEDRQTNLWAGTEGGLYRFRNERFEQVSGPAPLGGLIYSLLEDRQSRIWAGTGTGLILLDHGQTRVFSASEGIPDGHILALTEDSDGHVWAAIPGAGLFRQQNSRFVHYAAGQWPEEARVRSLYADADGALWIACYEVGLVRLKDGVFRRWSTADGLPDNGIHAVIEDDKRNLWFASNNGVFACPIAALEAYVPGHSPPLPCRRVSVEDGMESKACTGFAQPVVARTADGRFWFPNRQTLAVFDPQDLPDDRSLRPATVDQVLADGEPILIAGKPSVQASSRVRRFEVHYTSPNLQAGGRLRFRYRLEGLEQDWMDGGTERVANYSHLTPGRYEFQVIVGGPTGMWREATRLQLEVTPQWWQLRWLQAAAVLLGIGMIASAGWTVARTRAKRKLERFEMEQRVETERRRIARDMHDNLGSHLTGIANLGELAMRDHQSPGAVKSQLGLITGRVRELINAMDEVVWTVNPKNDSLPNLAAYLSDYTERFVAPTEVRYRLELDPEFPPVPVSAQIRHNLLLAVKEAINNAVRHAAPEIIYLKIHVQGRTLQVVVSDDGHGFETKQVKAGQDGLSNLVERMTLINGQVAIRSETGKGTTVTLSVPLASLPAAYS
jgi:ligand-binding sensor domain-containing protein/signal transduction histidine kinase